MKECEELKQASLLVLCNSTGSVVRNALQQSISALYARSEVTL